MTTSGSMALSKQWPELEERERLFAFLDDVYVICRQTECKQSTENMARDHARISLHNGKTKVAVVRRGDTSLPTSRQGLSLDLGDTRGPR